MKKRSPKFSRGQRYNQLFFRAPKGTTASIMTRVFDSLVTKGFNVHFRTPLPKLQAIRQDDDTWCLTCSQKDEKKVIRYLEERYGLELVRSEPDELEILVSKEPEVAYDDGCQ